MDLPEPGEVSLEDVMTVLERDTALWVSYCEDGCYTVWCLLQILDLIVDVRVINKPAAPGVEVSEFDHMKKLVNFIEELKEFGPDQHDGGVEDDSVEVEGAHGPDGARAETSKSAGKMVISEIILEDPFENCHIYLLLLTPSVHLKVENNIFIEI